MSCFSVAAVRATITAAANNGKNNRVTRLTSSRQSNVAVGGLSSSNSSSSSRSGGDVFRCRSCSTGRSEGDRSLEMGVGWGCQQQEEASSSSSSSSDRFFDILIQKNKSRVVGALTAAVVAGSIVGGVGADDAAAASVVTSVPPPSVGQVRTEVRKDVRMLQRELQIDAELIEREKEKDAEKLERLPITLEAFIAKEPPILIGFLALLIVNGAVGLTWALFFRETSAGPGGEFGKGVVAVRKEIVKGILKFFGSIMGSYVSRQDSRSR